MKVEAGKVVEYRAGVFVVQYEASAVDSRWQFNGKPA
jgi:hypothetical protein